MNIAIVGASNKPERYSYQALKLLSEHGHRVFPVHPRLTEIDGITVYDSLRKIPYLIEAVTMYLGTKAYTRNLIDEIMAVRPRQIIINPGAENDDLEKHAVQNGIKILHACTLVMVRTGRFY